MFSGVGIAFPTPGGIQGIGFPLLIAAAGPPFFSLFAMA